MNIISKFLCWCAGADIKLLKKYPEDITKQSSVGLAVLFTGVFALISGGYAAYRTFDYPNTLESPPVASYAYIYIGALWGLLIFNLDRFIVMSVKKTGSKAQLFWATFPRLVLAILISLVIAKPLEVRIFQDRITDTLADMELEDKLADKKKIEELTGLNADLATKSEKEKLMLQARQELNQSCDTEDCNRLRTSIPDAQSALNRAQDELNKEYKSLTADINWINNKKSDHWTFTYDKDNVKIYNLKSSSKIELDKKKGRRSYLIGVRNAKRKSLNSLTYQLNNAVAQFEKIKSDNYSSALKEAEKSASVADSTKAKSIAIFNKKEIETEKGLSNNFVAQIGALGELTKWQVAEEGKKYPSNTMYWINLALILLFIVVETAPILVKAIAPLSAYDYALDEKLQGRREDIEKNKQSKQLEHQAYMQKSTHNYEADIQHYIYTRSVAQSAALDSFNDKVDTWKNSSNSEDFEELLKSADKTKPKTS